MGTLFKGNALAGYITDDRHGTAADCRGFTGIHILADRIVFPESAFERLAVDGVLHAGLHVKVAPAVFGCLMPAFIKVFRALCADAVISGSFIDQRPLSRRGDGNGSCLFSGFRGSRSFADRGGKCDIPFLQQCIVSGRGIQIYAAGGRCGPFDSGACGQCARQCQGSGRPYPEGFFRSGDLNGDLSRFQRLQFLFRQFIFRQRLCGRFCRIRVRSFFSTCRFRCISLFRYFIPGYAVFFRQPFRSCLCRPGFLFVRDLFRLAVLFLDVRLFPIIFRNG